MKLRLFLVIFIFSVISNVSYAKTIFVDGNLSSNCGSGTYNLNSRSCGNGTDGSAYQTVEDGVMAMDEGDNLLIRKGYYEESSISIGFSGSTTTIQAYNKESVTIHNPYEPKTINDGEPTFRLQNSASNITFKDLALTGTKSSSADEDFTAIAIGQASGTPGNLITVDNCKISGFAHCGIKGAFKWWIKNCVFDDIGGIKNSVDDWHDHHIYSTGQQSSGNEAIIEYNYFGSSGGAALHLYSKPSYHIVRYNIFNGARSSGEGLYWGILLAGNNHKIYGNTIYDCYIGVGLYKNNCQDNEIKNNLFDSNINSDISIDFGGDNYPFGNIVLSNFYGSNTPCINCKDMRGDGGDDYSSYNNYPNIISNKNQFESSSQTQWSDFILASDSTCIDAGATLGANNKNGIDSRHNYWPANITDQNNHGNGWEIGAFIHDESDLLRPPRGLRVME